jgi:hypothetical protein
LKGNKMISNIFSVILQLLLVNIDIHHCNVHLFVNWLNIGLNLADTFVTC